MNNQVETVDAWCHYEGRGIQLLRTGGFGRVCLYNGRCSKVAGVREQLKGSDELKPGDTVCPPARVESRWTSTAGVEEEVVNCRCGSLEIGVVFKLR